MPRRRLRLTPFTAASRPRRRAAVAVRSMPFAALPRYTSQLAMEPPARARYLGIMDTETRAAFAALGEMMTAGFARADHYFELQHTQHLELRGEFAEMRGEFAELRGEVKALSARVDALTERVGSLEHEVSQLRDFVTREIAAIRLELRDLRAQADQSDDLRREMAELAIRVDRLERRT